jgi:hypothetical protein
MRAAIAPLVLLALACALPAAASASKPRHCVGAEEARASGEDEGPPKFTAAFYRHMITLDASLDGADGKGAAHLDRGRLRRPQEARQAGPAARRLRRHRAAPGVPAGAS